MPYAVELFLDDRATVQIRQIWAALDEAGITSLGSIPETDYHPHVSLSVFEHESPDKVAEALRPVLATCVGLPLPLAALGFFLTAEAVAFLGVAPSAGLIALHHQVYQAVDASAGDVWPYYRPGALVPHCTLGVGVADRARVIEVVERFAMPIHARATGAHLVQVPGGQRRTALTPTS
ncbi:MAG: 2'-5' RNA ligase family protein [Micromonosporaceae bacterium]|nr:2'-5' RNA ligase family protein [Micromonosporaceae bacterium]